MNHQEKNNVPVNLTNPRQTAHGEASSRRARESADASRRTRARFRWIDPETREQLVLQLEGCAELLEALEACGFERLEEEALGSGRAACSAVARALPFRAGDGASDRKGPPISRAQAGTAEPDSGPEQVPRGPGGVLRPSQGACFPGRRGAGPGPAA